jgi:hypothetical protein
VSVVPVLAGSIRPANSGEAALTPLSMIAIFLPAPLAPLCYATKALAAPR